MTMLASIDTTSRLNVQALGGGVLLLVWEGDKIATPRRFRPVIAGVPARPPFTHAAESISSNRERHFLAVRSTVGSAEPIAVEALGGGGAVSTVAAASSILGGDVSDLDACHLISGVDEAGRLRIARLLLETIGSLFKLGADPNFAAACRALFNELFDRPGALSVRCKILDEALLIEGAVPRSLTGRMRAVCVGAKGVRLLPASSVVVPVNVPRGERDAIALTPPPTFAGPGTAVFLIGDSGLCGRLIKAPSAPAIPTASEWLQSEAAASSPLRSVLLDTVARLAMTEAKAAALAAELRAISQHGSIRLGEPASPLAAGIDLVTAGVGGLFISGWLRDDAGLAEAIEIERLQQRTEMPLANLPRLPHPAVSGQTGGAAEVGGFVLFLPAAEGEVVLATCRLVLRLKSGTRLPFWEGQPLPANDSLRDRILATAPFDGRAETAIIDAILPWVRGYQDPRAKTVAAHQITAYGGEPQDPKFSLVMPLTDDPQLLRCTLTALAVDHTLLDGELIFVAERSACRPATERLLKDLLATYGLSARLVVLAPATGGGSLLNAGALIARAELIAFLGAGILPERPGWLPRLTQILCRDAKRGVIGAQILAEDLSLRMAGADLRIGERGVEVRPRMPGFPRDFRPVHAPAPSEVVSAAAMVMRRSMFEQSGGFDDRYLTPLYRDADLCLEVQRLGSSVVSVIEPAFIDLGDGKNFEPAAMAAARAIDRSLFTQRWRELLPSRGDAVGFPATAQRTTGEEDRQDREAA